MNGPRIGSLFSGYGGLDMGVQAVIGGSVAWHVEFDDAPSRILEHHYPGVPNFGDITAVDWAAVEPVDVLTGGFPCQDVSLAGVRRGLQDGTRSGLWSEFAVAIDRLRPQLVVIENVRGLLSAAAYRNLGPVERGLAETKRGHRPPLRAIGAVLGDLAELGYDARWVGVRAADAGAPHGRFRVFILAHPAGEPWSVGDGDDVRARRGTIGRQQAARRGSPSDSDGATGRPEPEGGVTSVAAEGTELEAGRRTGRGREVDTRPGPTAADARGRDERRGVAGLVGVAQGPDQGDRDQRERDGHTTADRSPATAAWGTYAAAVERWERRLGRRAPNPTRPDGKKGANRLNPAFVEWMMGLPEGWVTAPEVGLTRAQQLKALGNGVVPQQAALAVATLLEAEAVAA